MAFGNVLSSIFSALFVASILRISTPIILPALGGLISDLSGATNISLEGTMLVAAFTGVVVSAYTESVLLGVIGGILSGLLVAVILGIFHLHLKTDIFLAGIAINIMATGGTIFLLYILTGDKGNSSTLASGSMPFIDIPIIKDIPFIGTAFSGHNILVYVSFLLTWMVALFLYRTRLGVHLRAVGENAEAAASVGINTMRIRWLALLMSGFLAALGGLNMSMAYLTLFQREMTAGRGFIAIAAVHLGGRRPWGVLIASIIFGTFDALSNQLGSLDIAPQLVQVIPFVATIVALVVYNLRQKAVALERMRSFQDKELTTSETAGD
jgi:general nucleoside transport system permease protein